MKKKYGKGEPLTLGTIKRHPDGFGFFIPDDISLEDVYISKHSMSGSMSNDKVYVKVKEERDGRYSGEIVRIEKRANDKIFGVYRDKNNEYGELVDKENHWGENLKIKKNLSLNAKSGELVYVKIISYPGDERGFTGEVVELIGNSKDPLTDTRRAILTHSIPEGFSKKTMSDIRSLSTEVSEKDKTGRKDLRKLKLITIDGVTAKDFDDAIYVETTEKGFHLYVAVADVSHYVKQGTALDDDAYNKGNSSYFPMYVEPMLPEVLSNELCSLKPNVDRLCMVAEMHIDFSGTVTKTTLYEAVMCSHARVTYGEAQDTIDGNCPENFKHVEDVILTAADLAKILLKKRQREGSLDLEIPETEVIIDEAGLPIDIIRSERVFAHQVIEEMMLIANVEVAKFLTSKDVPAIFRTHDKPDALKIEALQKYLQSFEPNARVGTSGLQKQLSAILKNFEHRPEGLILNRLILRSLKQASYTVDNIGHFGLNFDFYTHFTSPIRRYPDLIVHRLIKCFINTNHDYALYSEEDLKSAATHCSATEQRSVKAERFLSGIKRARFLSTHLGEEFEGIITSVTKFGVFVSLRKFDIDGLIRLNDLGQDHFQFDEDRLELIGKKSGYRYKLGMPLDIAVSYVNVELGQIDFILAKDMKEYEASKEKPNRKHNKKRKKTKKNSKRSGKSRLSKSSGKAKAR